MTDYLVLGGETAGCVLASRLEEYCPSASMTLVEAGPDEHDDPLISVPMGTLQLHHSAYEYKYKTVPQKHYDNRQLFHTGGKLLSGSSAVCVLVAPRRFKSRLMLLQKLLGLDKR